MYCSNQNQISSPYVSKGKIQKTGSFFLYVPTYKNNKKKYNKPDPKETPVSGKPIKEHESLNQCFSNKRIINNEYNLTIRLLFCKCLMNCKRMLRKFLYKT